MARAEIQTLDNAPPIAMATLVATFGISLLALALPLVLLQVFDRVIPNQATVTLDVLFLGLLIALVFDLGFKICRILILGAEGERYELDLTRRVIGRILGADPAAFEKGRAGTHIDRQDAIAALRDYHGGQARLLHIDLPFSLLFVAMIYLIGGWLVLVPLSCLLILLTFRVVLRRAQGPILGNRRTLTERRYSFLIEFLSQISTVKCFGMEEQMRRRYESLQDQAVEANRRLTVVTQFSQSFGAVFSQVAVAGMGLFGAYLVIEDRIGIAELAACMLLNGRTIQPMLKLLGVWAQVEAVDESRRQLRALFDLPQRATHSTTESLRGEITFDSVTVHRENRPLIENLDIHLPAGGCLAITGADGSRNAVLMQLLLAECEPSSGEVLIDGRQPSEWSGMRGQGGLVPIGRRPVIFDGTILENLTLFGGGCSSELALKVARDIGLEEDVHSLPLGYDTLIGNRGGMTRGWQQRICLVRALALEPKILLLDEPNTALDHRGDMAVLSALKALSGKTTLVIASRRPSWLAIADHVLDLSVRETDIAEWEADEAADQGGSEALGPPEMKRIA
ncbi:MAG: ABC transporter transmembrane domain-containing protein [Pseudomonadota bacterium]